MGERNRSPQRRRSLETANEMISANQGDRTTHAANPKARFREQLHEVCRFKHLSPRTEEAYWG